VEQLKKSLKNPESFKKLLKPTEDFVKKVRKVANVHNIGDISVECGICGLAINEVEGMLAENITELAIEQAIQHDICDYLTGPLLAMCDNLVLQIPNIVAKIEAVESVGVICVGLGYCEKPFTPYPDPQPVPQYIINLDLPPSQRWNQICSNSSYIAIVNYLITTASSVLPNGGLYVQEVGQLLNDYYFPTEYAQEIKGCAATMGVSYGWLSLFNLGYEVSDACTSIVAQTKDGKIYHARNLDFWDGMGFTASLKDVAIEVAFQKKGQTVFHSTTFAGYAGVLSGMKPGAFSVTIDTRFYPDGVSELFYEVVAAIMEKNASLVTFESRNVLMNENDFEAAIDNLSEGELIADVYYILAGVSSGQGAVISRNRQNATDIWRLNSPTRWYEVETNYDHWEQPPWFDDRVTPANDGMNSMGQANLSLQGMFKVLSTKPVLNLQSTHTILACPADSSYKSFKRYCAYPCTE